MTARTIRLHHTDRRRGAADRIMRSFAAFTGAGFLFYLVLLLPSIFSQADHFPPWWTPLAALAVFGTGLGFGLSALLGDLKYLRFASIATAVTYLAALVTALWTVQDAALLDPQGVWLTTFPGVASLAAAAWRPVLAFAHMIVACSGAQLLNQAARVPTLNGPLVPEIAFSIMFCTLFVGAAVMALRTGRILDATLEGTHTAAAAAAASRARTVERARFDALIHDGVMSTLLIASRQGSTAQLSSQAGHTLRQLDALGAADEPDARFAAQDLLTHLRTAATAVDEDATVELHRGTGADSFTIPADAARAIGAALAEALRNCLRHAGPDAQRTVTATVDGHHLAVEVADTGPGFDPAEVPAHRLGVAVSILGRMRGLPGGSAHIESAPGAGTRVHLEWTAP